MKGDQLPKEYKELIKTVGFGQPLKQKGDIFKKIEGLKLQMKFRDGIRNRVDQVIDEYQEKHNGEKLGHDSDEDGGNSAKKVDLE